MEIKEVEILLPVGAPGRSPRLEPFLKGPIPLGAVAVAARLPGKALAVFLAIQHRSALTKSETVTLPKGLLTTFGIDRDAKARCLHALEEVSLVSVLRRKGRSATVTLLPKARIAR